MKKGLAWLLVIMMTIAALPAIALEIEEWKLDYYVDEFGDPTDTWYLQNLIPTITKGVGSNMAGLACIQVNQLSITIELCEDLNIVSGSSSKITNTTSSNKSVYQPYEDNTSNRSLI